MDLYLTSIESRSLLTRLRELGLQLLLGRLQEPFSRPHKGKTTLDSLRSKPWLQGVVRHHNMVGASCGARARW